MQVDCQPISPLKDACPLPKGDEQQAHLPRLLKSSRITCDDGHNPDHPQGPRLLIPTHYCPGDDFFIPRSRLMARYLALDLRFFDLNCFSPELASGRLLEIGRAHV